MEGGSPFGGNSLMDQSTLFASNDPSEWRLAPGSPEIDAGFVDPLALDSDLEGDPRVFYGTPDIGIDEWIDDCYRGAPATAGLRVAQLAGPLVEVALFQPFRIEVQQPLGVAVPVPFAIWAYIGHATPDLATVLPGGFGRMCFAPAELLGTPPGYFLLATSFGVPTPGLLNATLTPWTSDLLLAPVPLVFTFQGLVQTGPAQLGLSNGITLSAR